MRNSTQRQPTNDSTRRLLTTHPPPPPPTTSESIICSCYSISTFHATHRHLIPSTRTTTEHFLMCDDNNHFRSTPSLNFFSHGTSHPRHRYRSFTAWSGPPTMPADVTFLTVAISRNCSAVTMLLR